MSCAIPRALAAICLSCSVHAAPAPVAGSAATAPGHAWGYPFCGPQPAITAVFDHEHPTYDQPPNADPSTGQANGVIRLYNDTVQNHRAYDGHNGWDYRTREAGVNVKQPVFAVADGTVIHAGWHHAGGSTCDGPVPEHERGLGLVIAVRHGGRASLYGHLAAVGVTAGEAVARGQQIGATGSTGNASGPHLHFGAFTPDPYDLWHSVDPYGWNRDWQGLLDLPLPPGADPWHRAGGPASERLLLPGAADNPPCPATCPGSEPLVVDDRDPGFRLGCRQPPCRDWYSLPAGYRGHAWVTTPSGLSTDHFAEWTAAAPAGEYRVEAHIPQAAFFAGVHAARFEVGARTVVVDQHAEGNVWVDLGTHRFAAAPSVRLGDESWIGAWRDAGRCRFLAADAVRFTPICAPAAGPS